MRYRITKLAVVFVTASSLACGGGSPTSPSPTPAAAPAPAPAPAPTPTPTPAPQTASVQMSLRAERITGSSGLSIEAADVRTELAFNMVVDVTALLLPAVLNNIQCSGPPSLLGPPFEMITAGPLTRPLVAGRTETFRRRVRVNDPGTSTREPFTVQCHLAAVQDGATAPVNVSESFVVIWTTVGDDNVCVDTPRSSCLNGGRVEATAFLIFPNGQREQLQIASSNRSPNEVRFFLLDSRQVELTANVDGCPANAAPGDTFSTTVRNETPLDFQLLLRAIRSGVLFSHNRATDNDRRIGCAQ